MLTAVLHFLLIYILLNLAFLYLDANNNNNKNSNNNDDNNNNSNNNNKWHEKRMYEQFVRDMPEEIDKNLSRNWSMQSDLKVQTQATVCAAQEQALRTNYTKNKTDKASENPLCRMCGKRGETVQHITCAFKKPAQCEYKRRRDDAVEKLLH